MCAAGARHKCDVAREGLLARHFADFANFLYADDVEFLCGLGEHEALCVECAANILLEHFPVFEVGWLFPTCCRALFARYVCFRRCEHAGWRVAAAVTAWPRRRCLGFGRARRLRSLRRGRRARLLMARLPWLVTVALVGRAVRLMFLKHQDRRLGFSAVGRAAFEFRDILVADAEPAIRHRDSGFKVAAIKRESTVDAFARGPEPAHLGHELGARHWRGDEGLNLAVLPEGAFALGSFWHLSDSTSAQVDHQNIGQRHDGLCPNGRMVQATLAVRGLCTGFDLLLQQVGQVDAAHIFQRDFHAVLACELRPFQLLLGVLAGLLGGFGNFS